MDKYKKAVEYYAQNHQNNVLYNSGNDHAQIIFENIFNTAETYVDIYAGSLCNEFTKQKGYLQAFDDMFMKNKDINVRIIVSEYDRTEADCHDLFDLLRKLISKKFHITIKSLQNKSFVFNGKPFHFCVSDDRMYRYEYDVASRKAKCNFNDPVASLNLKSVFDEIYRVAEPVTV